MLRTFFCVDAKIALVTDCCCWSRHRVRQQLIDDRIVEHGDLLEHVISCSPGIIR